MIRLTDSEHQKKNKKNCEACCDAEAGKENSPAGSSEECAVSNGGSVYSIILINFSAFVVMRYFTGGLGAASILSLMALNFIAAFYLGGRKTWVASALISYSHLMIFAYVFSNFYYIDIFNVLCFSASLLLVAYSYMIGSAFIAFIFLAFAQIAAMNIYFDYFNVNVLFSGVGELGEIILMPLIFIPLVLMSFYHKLRSETMFCGAYLTVLITGLSFYLFIVNLKPSPGAVALVSAGFVLAFTAFILPAKPPADKESEGTAEDCESGAEIYARASGGALAVNLAAIAICTALGAYSFYYAKNPPRVFEFYSRGASLYHDDLAGYYARFNAPFSSVLADTNIYPALKVYKRKNFRVDSGPPWKLVMDDNAPASRGGFIIAAPAIDIKTLAGGLKSVTLDYPCLNAPIDEKKAAAISPRFVYKIKAGVHNDASASLMEFSLAGDRFLMLDENMPYNKFDNPVKNFFAVSCDNSRAAVYDFSGNIRIVELGGARTEMIISGLNSFKSVAAFGAADFLILCRDGVYKTTISDKKIERVPLAAHGTRNEFYDICAESGGGGAVLAAGPGSAVIIADGLKIMPLAIDLNDSNRPVFFDGDIIVCCDYFSQTVNIHKIKNSGSGYEIAGSLSAKTAVDSVVRAAAAAGSAGEGRNIVIGEYDPKLMRITARAINASVPVFAGTLEISVAGRSAAYCEFVPVFAGGRPAFILGYGDSLKIIRPGFFYDRETLVPLAAAHLNPAAPYLPSKLIAGGGLAVMAADNRINIIDLNGEKMTAAFEAAK